MYILVCSRYHKSVPGGLNKIQDIKLLVFADLFCELVHQAIDTPVVYVQEYLLCLLTMLSINGKFPSLFNHRELEIGYESPRIPCESPYRHEPFRYLNISLVELGNNVISSGLVL